MIQKVSGDITKSKAQAIAHGVAPNDDFHQGLALALREHAPSLYKDFRHYWQVQHPKPGELWVWMGADGQRIVNLYTQAPAEGHGKPGRASVGNVRHALKALRKFIDEEGIASIALPKLATGVGGLEWAEVEPLIVEQLGDLKIPVIVYETFHPGEAAAEKL
ncbi:Appr-1-p processing protein [Lysobacter pythonis]|uniref:Appr-1-p processing protein n=1 Tax=Solilutibacter pythonis TaxID=2483112 RepID=A0A3M2HII6_9GAMM|nr:macro domain-containing protein [Lysobacter pythonis]RMH89536.1 Appr-1-p processing protein [Lysobacter pythonis]